MEEDRTRRRSAVRSASHVDDSDSSCSGSSSVEDTEEEDESEAEDAMQGEESEGGPPRTGKCSVEMTMDGESGQTKRRSRLAERVVRVLAQCQACLYDVAVVPCEVRDLVRGHEFLQRWTTDARSALIYRMSKA